MLLLISPAKSLNLEPTAYENHTQPALLEETKVLVDRLRGINTEELQQLMHISEKLAVLNVERNHSFEFPFDRQNAKQAVLTFDGDVYTGLDAASFSEEELAFAQDHIGILSGLYGLLRPLDLMQPYRLEMGTKMQVKDHKNLYQYWGDKITDLINERAVKYIVNLASNEYFKSVNKKKLNGELIEVSFKENKNGKYKIVAFYAKKARGLMCQYVVKNKLTTPEQMKSFDWDDYTFNEELSSANAYVFTR